MIQVEEKLNIKRALINIWKDILNGAMNDIQKGIVKHNPTKEDIDRFDDAIEAKKMAQEQLKYLES